MKLKELHWPKDGASCAMCGLAMDMHTAQLNHIKPMAEGGTSDPLNLMWLCGNCNVRRTMEKAANVLSSVSNISGIAAKGWLKLFYLSPRITGFGTATAALAVAIFVVVSKPQPVAPKHPSYQEQMQSLDQTQQSLDQLSEFVERQRAAIATDQTVIARLKNEQARLRPLVEADRKTVDALLAEQQARSDASQARERWIGAAIGIAGGILVSVAAAIGSVFLRFLAKRWKG